MTSIQPEQIILIQELLEQQAALGNKGVYNFPGEDGVMASVSVRTYPDRELFTLRVHDTVLPTDVHTGVLDMTIPQGGVPVLELCEPIGFFEGGGYSRPIAATIENVEILLSAAGLQLPRSDVVLMLPATG